MRCIRVCWWEIGRSSLSWGNLIKSRCWCSSRSVVVFLAKGLMFVDKFPLDSDLWLVKYRLKMESKSGSGLYRQMRCWATIKDSRFWMDFIVGTRECLARWLGKRKESSFWGVRRHIRRLEVSDGKMYRWCKGTASQSITRSSRTTSSANSEQTTNDF